MRPYTSAWSSWSWGPWHDFDHLKPVHARRCGVCGLPTSGRRESHHLDCLRAAIAEIADKVREEAR